jgi:hypothetical protein
VQAATLQRRRAGLLQFQEQLVHGLSAESGIWGTFFLYRHGKTEPPAMGEERVVSEKILAVKAQGKPGFLWVAAFGHQRLPRARPRTAGPG